MNAQNSQRPNRSPETGPASGGEIKTVASQQPGISGLRRRTRAERVAAHFTYYGLFRQIVAGIQNVEIRKQILLVVLATLAMSVATQAWNPPFPYAEYDISDRDIVCRVAFTLPEEGALYPAPRASWDESRLQPEPFQAVSLPLRQGEELEDADSTQPSSENEPDLENGGWQPSANAAVSLSAEQPIDRLSQNMDIPPLAFLEDDRPGRLVVSANGDGTRVFVPGLVLVHADQVISPWHLGVLQAEYLEIMSHRTWGEKLSRFCGACFLTLSLFFLALVFLRRRERRRPKSLPGTAALYFLMIVTVIAATVMHGYVKNGANLELIPTLLFAQGIAVAFSWELALILTAIISFVFVLSQANSIFTMFLLVGVSASIVIHLGRLRSRTKLIVVGSFGAGIAFLLTLFIQMTEGQEITDVILKYACLNAFWTCAAAFLMTGLLPFIERPCGILTDMSLLELGDPSHPLLHELTRRAPATYSHSLQVASIAETAAEAVGARGLLVRVGAYFHDIGKLMNPEYFMENQQAGQNLHDHLEPGMSTLVIVAHVKDGVNLVRQHRVPQPIIDLVEQHHGTSRVSFFHTLAAKQNRDQGYGTSIDEGGFRYPGPKPQSKEASILMLADAAESACRSLREPTPGKIEAMVRHISEDKLKDGQYDESGMTLQELRTIEKSIIHSILAVRHIRTGYPDMGTRKTGDSAETKAQNASGNMESQ